MIVLVSDHAGFPLKEEIKKHLEVNIPITPQILITWQPCILR